LLEVSGHDEQPQEGFALWLQVRDVAGEHERLTKAGVTATRPPQREPWGLSRCGYKTPTACGSPWCKCPRTTRSAGPALNSRQAAE
jgi:uncharacterized glyoxalase superfamily protein PhnB